MDSEKIQDIQKLNDNDAFELAGSYQASDKNTPPVSTVILSNKKAEVGRGDDSGTCASGAKLVDSFSQWSLISSFQRPIGVITAVSASDKTIDVFGNHYGDIIRIFFDGSSWSNWVEVVDITGNYNSEIDAVSLGDGRIWVFVTSKSGDAVYFETFSGPTRVWSGPFNLGNPRSPGVWGPPVVTSRGRGRVDMAVNITGTGPYYWWLRRYENGGWTGWEGIEIALGTGMASDFMSYGEDMLIIGKGVAGLSRAFYSGGGWGSVETFDGGSCFNLRGASSKPGPFDIFRSNSGTLETGILSPSSWSGWNSLGGVGIDWITAVSATEGQVDVFATPAAAELWRISK